MNLVQTDDDNTHNTILLMMLLLTLWEFHRIYFDCIHPPPNSFQIHPPNFMFSSLNPYSPICTAHILGSAGPNPRTTSLKKTGTSFPNGYQMPIAPQLWVGLHAHLLVSRRAFYLPWAFAGLIHEIKIITRSHGQLSCCIHQTWLPWCPLLLRFLESFCPLYHKDPWGLVKRI